jgi:hypothetical protein
LTVEGSSTISIATDANDLDFSTPRVRVVDQATLSGDTEINATIENFSLEALEITLIEAGALSIEDGDVSGVVVGAPAIYSESIIVDANSLRVTLAPKSAIDLGFNGNETAAYASFLAVAAENEAVGSSLTDIEDVDDLRAAYRNILPDYTDVATRFLSDQTSIAKGSIAGRFDQILAGRDGFWFSGSGEYLREEASEEATGYSGLGVAFQTGYDRNLNDYVNVGGSGAIRIGKFSPESNVNGEIEATSFDFSLYSSLGFGKLQVDLSGTIGRANFYSDRSTTLANALEIYRGEWDGIYYAGGARIGYEERFGHYYIRPAVSIDYFSMSQDEHVDSAGGDDLLSVSIGEADTSRSSGAAILNLGRRTSRVSRARGRNAYRSPANATETVYFQNLYGGYRAEIDADAYDAEARFLMGGDSFSVSDSTGYEDALLAGVSLGAIGDGYVLTVGYDGQFAGDFMSHKIGASFKLSF